MANFIDLTGQRFGRLVVVSRSTNTNAGSARWNCVCDCGGTTIAIGEDLRAGHTKSCGCLKKEITTERSRTHGMSRTSTNKIWRGIRLRCTNPNEAAYKNYGGRGITICERWNKFENFYADMGERPDGMSIERKDNNKGYSPENCCWATRKSQARNRRTNRIIKYDGREQCLIEWAEELGINYGILSSRLRRYPPQFAFNM